MIHAIFAMDGRGGMGIDGKLPWGNISEDMKHFKAVTDGGIVVMGRKTWDSLPDNYKPLSNRINAVVSSTQVSYPNFFIYNFQIHQLEKQMHSLNERFPERKLFIIGGSQLLTSCVKIIDFIYLTRVRGTHDCDTFINPRTFFDNFNLFTTRPPVNKCTFEEYRRK